MSNVQDEICDGDTRTYAPEYIAAVRDSLYALADEYTVQFAQQLG